MRIHPTNRSCRVRPHVAATGYDCTQQATPRPSRHKNFFAPVQHSRSPVHLTEKQRHETLHLRAPFRHLLHCGLCLYPQFLLLYQPPAPPAYDYVAVETPCDETVLLDGDTLRYGMTPERLVEQLHLQSDRKELDKFAQIIHDLNPPQTVYGVFPTTSERVTVEIQTRDSTFVFAIGPNERDKRSHRQTTVQRRQKKYSPAPDICRDGAGYRLTPKKGLLSHKASGTTAPYAFRRHIPTGQSQPLPVSSVDTLLLLPPRSSRRRTALLRFHRGRSRHRIPLPRQTGNSRRVERDALLLHPRPGTARHCMEQPPRGVFRHDGRHLGLPSSSPVHIRLRSQLHPLSLGLPLRHTGRGRNAAGTAGTRKLRDHYWAAGVSVAGYVNITPRILFGISYKPTFLRFGNPEPWRYEHTIAIELKFYLLR